MPKTYTPKQFIRILHYLQVILVLVIVPLLYNYIAIDKNAEETLYIDAKNSESIVTSLESNGYTLTFVDKMMLNIGQEPDSGWYTLEKDIQGRFAFFKNISKHKAKTMKIVIYAAETHQELLKRLANDMKLDEKKLREVYKEQSPFKEAAIFSGHYQVARKASEESIMRYLLAESKQVLDFFIEKSFTNKPDHFEVKVLLTIASIVQKESNAVEEMPIISAVIYNRLKKNMKLQMDSTLNYGKFSHTIVTPERIKTDTSYYNTYKHKGLPPYPLGSVSAEALRAAMFPDDNNYIFFMLKPNGKHAFSETYDEHLCNIREFREYQKRRAEEKKKKEETRAKIEALAKKKALEKKEALKKKEAEAKKSKENNSSEGNISKIKSKIVN